jgi:hypothetical protein
MKIYVAHSKDFDFQEELYKPIKNSSLNKEHTFVFPHDKSGEIFNSKDFFKKDCDLVVAEVSYPATGLGIELGWADILNVPIACLYKKGFKIPNSLKVVTDMFLEYSNIDELIAKIGETITKLSK